MMVISVRYEITDIIEKTQITISTFTFNKLQRSIVLLLV